MLPVLPLLLLCPLITLSAPRAGAQASDVKLTGTTLTRFLKTKGASLRGKDVHWRLPAKLFARPKEKRRGHDVFVHKGIALTIRSTSRDLREIRRRGGTASVRGRVIRIPLSRRKKGGPQYAIAIREIRRRRK